MMLYYSLVCYIYWEFCHYAIYQLMNPIESVQEAFNNKEHFPEHAEWISDHLHQFYDEKDIVVFHELLSLDFHLDVYLINHADHKFNILLTSGMSTYKMIVEDHVPEKENYEFAELMLLIPKDIEFSSNVLGKGEYDWIISMLKQTARFPHHYDTWFGEGHTIFADADKIPYDDNTKYCGVILLPSITLSHDFTTISKEGRTINIHSVFPLYLNELEYKVENGYSKFYDLLASANAKEIFDSKRANLLS